MPADTSSERIVFVNGAYVPESEAKISVFDRGFLFGDGVYEVSSVLGGRLIDNSAHLARLKRSLAALSIAQPLDDDALVSMQKRLIRENALTEGVVYLQISRGVADRSFDWPSEPTPSLVAFTQAKNILENPKAEAGLSVAFGPDLRWKRRDIKTVNLLPASWAKAQAAEAGADDVWMVEPDDDGVVKITEGSSNNAFILTADNVLVTRALSNDILHGITRAAATSLAEHAQIRIEQRSFTPDEARAAKEAFVTSASSFVMPVTKIDGVTVGDGTPGPVTRRLRELYIEHAFATAEPAETGD